MKLVRAAACALLPWKNGGGVTRDLLGWPDRDSWVLRVSVALIERDGPFSDYPGVQRSFAVLDGSGVELEWPGRTLRLTPADPPIAFDGAAPPMCRLLAGPTTDLNLMLREGHGQAQARRAGRGPAPAGAARWRGLYAASAARLDADGTLHSLEAGTLAWTDTPAAERWTLIDAAQAYWLHVMEAR